tara:strand:+ start:608 stop:757 length:150 start_codon:yes stop_codon:yes gene_type:complete
MILLVWPGSDKISRRPSDALVDREAVLPVAATIPDALLVTDFLGRTSTL